MSIHLTRRKLVALGILLAFCFLGAGPQASAHPGAAPHALDYCQGFQNPPVPTLNQEPFLFEPIPDSLAFLPLAIADYDNDGDLDTPFAENLGNYQFQYQPAIYNLIIGSGAGQPSPAPGRLWQSIRTGPLKVNSEQPNFHGVAALDYDDDGWTDLLVAPYDYTGVPIMLFHNKGNWQFELAHENFFKNLLGFNAASQWASETIAWADLTGDGINDAYIPLYTFKDPYQSLLLVGQSAAFTEEALARGVGIPNIPASLRPEGAQAADIDNDGDLDLYVAHHLFINDGTGHFADAAAGYGLPITFDEGMAFVDYDNDGLLDIYLRSPDVANVLFRNTGSGFVNTSISSGLSCLIQNAGFLWGDAWADFDADGHVDLLYTTVESSGLGYAVMLNQGDGTFKLGYRAPHLILLSAAADIDLDGDPDLFTLWQPGYGLLVRNVFPRPAPGYALAVTPLDAQGRMNQQGTTIRVNDLCSSEIQTRVIGDNNVYLSQGEYTARFSVPVTCPQEISVTFLKQGNQSQKTVLILYDPASEYSINITVTRSGYTKTLNARPEQYLPVIQK